MKSIKEVMDESFWLTVLRESLKMSIKDWSDEKLMREAAPREARDLVNYIIALRAELREAMSTRFDESLGESPNYRAERDALAGQVAALRSVLRSVRLNGNFCDGRDVDRHDAKIDAALADPASAAVARDADLIRKERGMVACLHNALAGLVNWVLYDRDKVGKFSPPPHQWDLANKVLADATPMAAEHNAKVHDEAFEAGYEQCRSLEKVLGASETAAIRRAVFLECAERLKRDANRATLDRTGVERKTLLRCAEGATALADKAGAK